MYVPLFKAGKVVGFIGELNEIVDEILKEAGKL